MQGLDTHATQLHRHAGGHNPTLLHGLDVLEGETALAIVLVRTGGKFSGMLFGERDEARAGGGVRLQCEVHHKSSSCEDEGDSIGTKMEMDRDATAKKGACSFDCTCVRQIIPAV
jgi:hypothetical protein